MTLKEASEQLRRRAVSAVELTQACLSELRRTTLRSTRSSRSPGSKLSVARAKWTQSASGAGCGPASWHSHRAEGQHGHRGIRTTAASELFRDRVPSEDAEVVRRLKDAGAILIGKTNLHEFAYGGSSTVGHFGPVRNPWALDRIAGGSSGGSAAATAASLCFGSLGTDTAGSVRMPACVLRHRGIQADIRPDQQSRRNSVVLDT